MLTKNVLKFRILWREMSETSGLIFIRNPSKFLWARITILICQQSLANANEFDGYVQTSPLCRRLKRLNDSSPDFLFFNSWKFSWVCPPTWVPSGWAVYHCDPCLKASNRFSKRVSPCHNFLWLCAYKAQRKHDSYFFLHTTSHHSLIII